MCELCDLTNGDPEVRKSAFNIATSKSVRIAELAKELNRLAYGEIKPHSEESKIVAFKAKGVIRMLVEDWL